MFIVESSVKPKNISISALASLSGHSFFIRISKTLINKSDTHQLQVINENIDRSRCALNSLCSKQTRISLLGFLICAWDWRFAVLQTISVFLCILGYLIRANSLLHFMEILLSHAFYENIERFRIWADACCLMNHFCLFEVSLTHRCFFVSQLHEANMENRICSILQENCETIGVGKSSDDLIQLR